MFQTDLSYVIPNQTSYEVWEFHEVLDHLMVIPKRHVEHLSELTDAEVLDIGHIIGRYDALGYSSYARAPLNRRRSVTHQHTHLIKIADKPVRFSLLLTKPYHLIKF